jgi:hypothetical protein
MNTFSRTRYRRVASRLRRQAGVTMVEFALTMPFALLLVLSIVQLGLMFTAKQLLNTAAFMAARTGAVQHAQVDKITAAMHKGLIPFYQNSTEGNDGKRLQDALDKARSDTACPGDCFLKVERLNPSPESFADFAMTEGKQDYIPNDSLEYRLRGVGATSNQSIHDANVLKIKVTYGYELKVPLMKSVFGAVMCGVDSGYAAFGSASDLVGAANSNCDAFYKKGRIPLVTYAIVQMQTPAFP